MNRLVPPSVIVVLGARVRRTRGGLLCGALRARVHRAWAVYRERPDETRIVVTGGAHGGSECEADAMHGELLSLGATPSHIVRERWARSTHENAVYASRFVRALRASSALVVTSGFHLPRALLLFRKEGLRVVGLSADPPSVRPKRTHRLLEWCKQGLAGVLLGVLALGCKKAPPAPATEEAKPVTPTTEEVRASEYARDGTKVSRAFLSSPDLSFRRAAARAIAQIGADTQAMMSGLSDVDEDVVRWSAHGLMLACHFGGEEAVQKGAARAGVSRLMTLGALPSAAEAIVRMVGRCGGDPEEQFLRQELSAPHAGAVLFALGDMAGRRRTLSGETMATLLGSSDPWSLYPLSRLEPLADPEGRIRVAAERAVTVPGPARVFALRVLSKLGMSALPTLRAVVMDRTFSIAERAQAISALGARGELGKQTYDLSELPYPLSLLWLRNVRAPLTKEVQKTLSLYQKRVSFEKKATRRTRALACLSASVLAEDRWTDPVIDACDPGHGPPWAEARLRALLARPLEGGRARAWQELLAVSDVRVRHRMLDALPNHPEIEAGPILEAALQSGHSGLVAHAAEVVHAHPERVSASTQHALMDAWGKVLPDDAFETRVALLKAMLSSRVPDAARRVQTLCASPNGTVRKEAHKALQSSGEKDGCGAIAPERAPARRWGHERARVTLVLDTAARVTLSLDDEDATANVAQITALARGGFYRGIVMHRVLPNFVVQLGDPEGDGYGGSGVPLPCETSNTPFERLHIGMAHAGRDTASSQLFVTLVPTPHLTGIHTHLGVASGPWEEVAEGDVIVDTEVAGLP